jgi:hypothetical protein
MVSWLELPHTGQHLAFFGFGILTSANPYETGERRYTGQFGMALKRYALAKLPEISIMSKSVELLEACS